jgi:hypothetical protein
VVGEAAGDHLGDVDTAMIPAVVAATGLTRVDAGFVPFL